MGKDKKVWSELEDQLLKKFYEEQQMRNWSLIAKKMAEEYNTPKKSGKQCRQRYENHIDTSVVKIQWTRDEEKQLIQLHNDIGNKWANIALQLPGKSDNCVKNHFYSKLRKVLRKLNKIIHHYFRRAFREININVIYKLVEATEERFKQKPNCSEEVSLKCREIQNRMLDMALANQDEDSEEDDQQNLQMYRDMIQEIYVASKEYKRKSKKSRNMSILAPNVKKNKERHPSKSAKAPAQKAPSDGYMSDSSNSEDSKEESDYQRNNQPPRSFIVNEHQKPSLLPKKIQIEEGKEGIQNMLRENNILENEFSHMPGGGNNYFKFSDKSSFKSYNSDRESDRDFFNMFESSDMQMGGRRKNSKYLYFAQRPDDNNMSFSEKE